MKSTLTLILLFIIVLVFLCFISSKLSAQDTKRDSIKQHSLTYTNNIYSIAESDGRKQQLSLAEMRNFLSGKKKFRSYFFNPKNDFVSNTALLADSNYLKAFRKAAYQRALDDLAIIPRCVWGAFGPGIDNISSKNLNLAINGSIELSKKQLISADIRLNAAVLWGTTTSSCSVLYGGIFKEGNCFFTISTGISVINITTTYFYLFSAPAPETSTTNLGVPIVVQGYFVAGKHAGFGLSAYVNLNSVNTTAGINLSFAFGRLATHGK